MQFDKDLSGSTGCLMYGGRIRLLNRCLSPYASNRLSFAHGAATRRPLTAASAFMTSSAMPSQKYCCSGSGLMFSNGSTAIEWVVAGR